MKKIELTVEEVKNRVLPCKLSVALLPNDISAITRNLNEFLSKKQSECSQVEWFKLSDKRPMNGDLVIWVNETDRRTQLVLYISGTESPIADRVYWTPCPTPPECDSPCVKELKTLKENNRCLDYARAIDATIEIVKRHEKKEKE